MDRCASDEYADFGVLFVYGIGEQRPGSAVAALGAAIYGWLFRWNCAKRLSPASSPLLSDTVLSYGQNRDGGPAHLVLSAPLPLSTGPEPARWLLAESAWADAAVPPRFLDLAHWIWKVSTCMLVLQFVIPMRRHWRQATKAPAHLRDLPGRLCAATFACVYAGLMAGAAMLSVLLSGLLLVLGIAALLPIPRIDAAVTWVVVRLSAVLGDSYLLAHCPVQFSAMCTRVARDLGWLQQHCDKVAIVAHSQGAAIAHEVLKTGGYPPKLKTFITFGQGISKLHLLRRMDWDPQARLAARSSRLLVAIGLACAGLPALSVLIRRWAHAAIFKDVTTFPAYAWIIVAGLALITTGILAALQALHGELEKDLLLPVTESRRRWSDYYASADPVSNGPLIPKHARGRGGGAAQDGLRPSPCEEIYSGASVVTDHNSYLRNPDQFLSGLLNDLVAAAYGTSDDRPAEVHLVCDRDLRKVRRRRKLLADSLVAARVLMLGLGFAVWWSDPSRILKGPMNWLVHLIDPHAGIGENLARLVAAALITAAAYVIIVLPLWRFAEAQVAGRFFHHATRYVKATTQTSPDSPSALAPEHGPPLAVS